MYKISKETYGYKLLFNGYIEKDEMQSWVDESRSVLASQQGSFHVFVDMRNLDTLPSDAKVVMEQGQALYKNGGMIRSVVIVNKPITKMQFQAIAKKTGIDQWERYISSEETPDWERKGTGWLQHETEPGT